MSTETTVLGPKLTPKGWHLDQDDPWLPLQLGWFRIYLALHVSSDQELGLVRSL